MLERLILKIKSHFNLAVFGAMFVLSFLVYFPILNSFFVSDDFDLINNVARSGKSIGSYFYSVQNLAAGVKFYRPMINLTLFIDYKIWGLNPLGFHLDNLIFHIGSSFLVYLIIKNFGEFKHKKAISAAAALFFAVLPMHSEPVVWIAARTDTVCVFFYLLAFFLYLKWRNGNNKLILTGGLIAGFLALASKEMAISLPGLIIFYEFYRARTINRVWRLDKKGWWNIFSFSGLFILYLFIRNYSLGTFIGGYGASVHSAMAPKMMIRMLIADFTVLGLQLFGWPKVLVTTFFYSHPVLWLIVIAVISFGLFCFFANRDRQVLLFIIGFFGLTILPVINLGINLPDNEGERYLYLPSVAFVWLLAAIIFNLNTKSIHSLKILIVAVLMIFFVVSLSIKNNNWRTASSVSENIIKSYGEIAEENDRNNFGAVVFALPDSVNGSQVMRNGFIEGINLFYGYKPDVLLLPFRLVLSSGDINRNLFIYDSFNDKIWIKTIDGQWLFTGSRFVDSLDVQAELTHAHMGYDTNDFLRSEDVKIKFSDKFKTENLGKKIYYLIFNNGRLEEAPIGGCDNYSCNVSP